MTSISANGMLMLTDDMSSSGRSFTPFKTPRDVQDAIAAKVYDGTKQNTANVRYLSSKVWLRVVCKTLSEEDLQAQLRSVLNDFRERILEGETYVFERLYLQKTNVRYRGLPVYYVSFRIRREFLPFVQQVSTTEKEKSCQSQPAKTKFLAAV